MKNILKIKKLSSALLVGTIMIGSSAMTVRAAYKRSPDMTIYNFASGANPEGHNFQDFAYLVVDEKTGKREIMIDSYEKSDDSVERFAEGNGEWFIFNGKKIPKSTCIRDVHPNGSNMLVVYNGAPDKPADEVWEETEYDRGQIRVNKKRVDLDSKEEEELGEDNVYRKEPIYEYPYLKTGKHQVRFINGQRVDEDKNFGDYENVNGDNSVIVYTSNDLDALPQ